MGSVAAREHIGFYGSVTVESVNPNRYAIGQTTDTFEILGHGLLSIPADALGVDSIVGDNPLAHRYSTASQSLYDIVERTNERLLLRVRSSSVLQNNIYLGGIVSKDRQVVYWVASSGARSAKRKNKDANHDLDK